MFSFCVQSAFLAKNIAAENIVFSAICFPNFSETQWSESHSVMSNSSWPHGLYSPWNSPSQNTGVGRHSLLQGIFLTQGSNPGLPHCRWILYQLSHKGSPSETLCRHQLIWCVTEFCLVRLNWKSCWDAPEIFLSDNVYPSSTLLSASWNEFVMTDSRAVILNHEYGCFMLGRMVSWQKSGSQMISWKYQTSSAMLSLTFRYVREKQTST